MPESIQILKYAGFYAKEKFFMKIMLKAQSYARSGHTVCGAIVCFPDCDVINLNLT